MVKFFAKANSPIGKCTFIRTFVIYKIKLMHFEHVTFRAYFIADAKLVCGLAGISVSHLIHLQSG